MHLFCFIYVLELQFFDSVAVGSLSSTLSSIASTRSDTQFFPIESHHACVVDWVGWRFYCLCCCFVFFSSLPAGRILVCCLRWLTFKKHIECVHLSEQLENSPAEIDIDERFYWYQYERYAGTLYRKRKPYVSNTPVVRCVVSKNNNRIHRLLRYSIRSFDLSSPLNESHFDSMNGSDHMKMKLKIKRNIVCVWLTTEITNYTHIDILM